MWHIRTIILTILKKFDGLKEDLKNNRLKSKSKNYSRSKKTVLTKVSKDLFYIFSDSGLYINLREKNLLS